MQWRGVMPAITTCFDRELAVDHEFMARHCRWLIDNGCTAIVALGSLGEAASSGARGKDQNFNELRGRARRPYAIGSWNFRSDHQRGGAVG